MSAKDDAVVIVDEAKLELEDYPLKDNDKRWRKAVKQSQKVSETEVQGATFAFLLWFAQLVELTVPQSHSSQGRRDGPASDAEGVRYVCRSSLAICASMLIYAPSVCRTYEYGPSIGLTRLERWERANTLGLKPPSEVSIVTPSTFG